MFFDQQYTVVLGLVGVLSGFGTPNVAASQAESQIAARSSDVDTEVQVYGQVPQPNQIRQSYLVFEPIGSNEVVGAYYQPRSEFSCFMGSRDGNDLSLQIYDARGVASADVEVSLDELHSLPNPSSNDERILSVCRDGFAVAGQQASTK